MGNQNQSEKSNGAPVGYFAKLKKIIWILLAVIVAYAFYTGNGESQSPVEQQDEVAFVEPEPRCLKVVPLVPSFNGSVDSILKDPEFRKLSIERLSKAVQVPTEIQDTNPIPADDPEYYTHFFEFHKYLEEYFPLVHKHLKLEKVNGVGLLYTWEGSEQDLKPILFMAHQDVVPVDRKTWDDWKHPPFSGHYDEETASVWGRGSLDCKNLLIAEFAAIEQLLVDGFKPRRTVLLSSGFDEESSGPLGAKTLSQYIEQRYGRDSVYGIIDEGFGVIAVDKDVFIAAPLNGEKGKVDVNITVHGHGGHSSVPPDHTTIGVAAELITVLENHPFESNFKIESPIFGFLTCAAEHSNIIPQSLKENILGAPVDATKAAILAKFIGSDPRFRDTVRTTRAIDIIHGGIKSNALPEVTTFLVNHRVDIYSSVKETAEMDLKYARQIAEKHGYGLFFEGEELIPATKLGHIEVKIVKALEPAPISPSSGPVWDILAGTIQDVFENGVFSDKPEAELYVTTTLLSSNTDTRHYWNLTKNIYRFQASILEFGVAKRIHSVDEHMTVGGHLSAIAFVYEYIINVDENAGEIEVLNQ